MLSKAASSTFFFFESLVWVDLGLNSGLPDHWWTLYPLNQWPTGGDFFFFFFHHTTCESTCDTLTSSATNQGDNSFGNSRRYYFISGATKQLLPPDRVFKRNIYLYIHKINYKQTLHWTFIHLHFGAVYDLKTRLLTAIDVIATVSWFCIITRGRWLRMYIIHVEILPIFVIYSVCFLSFMRYYPKALETNVLYNSVERCYLLINGPSGWVVSKKKAPGLSLSK